MGHVAWNKETKDDVKKRVEKFGYRLLNIYYRKCDKNHKYKRIVIKDKYGYKYDTTLYGIPKKYGTRFVYRVNPYSLENISLWLKLNNKNFKLIKNNSYNGKREKLRFYCFECNEIFESCWDDIYSGVGCGICRGFQIGKYNNLKYKRPDLIKEWDFDNNKINPEKISEFSNKYAFWICCNCKHKWKAQISDRTSSSGTGCPKCKKSHGENRIQKFLDGNNIFYEVQYKINECRNIRPLKFDFAIFKNKKLFCLIEYDGELHTQTHRYLSKSKANKKLKEQQKRDKIKNKYCKDNGIKLIRIPYWDYDNIEIILKKELKIK